MDTLFPVITDQQLDSVIRTLPHTSSQVLLDEPSIVLIDQFLTDAECDYLVDRYYDHVNPAGFIDDNGKEVVSRRRTSKSCPTDDEDTTVQAINERIELLTYWPILKMESLNFVRYVPGEEIQPHHDFFGSSNKALERGGQRMATIIIYLNDADDSGKTTFDELDLSIHPRKGRLLFFSYPDSDERLRHGSRPLASGEKYILVKWLRAGLHIPE